MLIAGVLLLLLPLLAMLQYRWLSQLRERESEHQKTNLRSIATRFCQDFDDEITRLYFSFGLPPENDPASKDALLSSLRSRYARWVESTQASKIVDRILFAEMEPAKRLQVDEFQPATGQFASVSWPADLEELRQQIEQFGNEGLGNPGREGGPRRLRGLDGETMTLLYPIFSPPRFGERGGFAIMPPARFLILRLNLAEIQNEYLPGLIKRHFSDPGFEYSAEIVSLPPNEKKIFSFGADSLSSGRKNSNADVTMPLFGLRREEIRRLLNRSGGPGEGPPLSMARPQEGPPATRPPNDRRMPPFFRAGMMGLGGPNEDQKFWQLRLTHRAGSLDAAVGSLHRRNLLVSFSILGVLAASIVLMALSARRAHALARQQMDFVAGVSHELRTPLAVIKSAAWNLNRGVIRDPDQISRYSTLIGKESDRLIEMIEQVLEFAGAESDRQKFALQPTQIPHLIDSVLASAQPAIAEGNFQIEKQIAASLPQVMADGPAIGRALRNLLDNAMKYSGNDPRITIEARATNGSHPMIHIAVRDHGLGIPPEEQKKIFEPFWRGTEATAAQIHGNGLGLHLVKKIVTAHGGSIDVQSDVGKGSVFTLSLPSIE